MIQCKNLIREISILRQLGAIKSNVFTCQIIDVMIKETDEKDIENCSGIFLIMEYVNCDLWKLIHLQPITDFTENHVKFIMYNLLCAMQFIHSANIMHRDIKPGNILIDDLCHIKICDFGQARTIPEPSDLEKVLLVSSIKLSVKLCCNLRNIEKNIVEITNYIRTYKS